MEYLRNDILQNFGDWFPNLKDIDNETIVLNTLSNRDPTGNALIALYSMIANAYTQDKWEKLQPLAEKTIHFLSSKNLSLLSQETVQKIRDQLEHKIHPSLKQRRSSEELETPKQQTLLTVIKQTLLKKDFDKTLESIESSISHESLTEIFESIDKESLHAFVKKAIVNGGEHTCLVVKAFIHTKGESANSALEGNSLLHQAIVQTNTKLVRLLLEEKANVKATTKSGETPLHIACKKGSKEIVELLIANGAELEAQTEEGDTWFAGRDTPLHLACEGGFIEIAKLLIERGVDLKAENKGRRTPLHIACQSGSKEIVELLIANGADVNARSYIERPLHMACQSRSKEIVKILLEKGADIHAKTQAGYTPLHIACKEGFKEIVELLLNQGADPRIRAIFDGNNPFHTACKEGFTEIVKLLIKKGVDIQEENSWGEIPLNIACKKGSKEIIELLIANGADVNSKNKDGYTPLHIACKNESKEIVELLIKRGIDVNATTQSGEQPLQIACERGSNEIAKLLIENGADVNMVNNFNETPLHAACQQGSKELIELLIEKGAGVNAKNLVGYTPFHVACQRGSKEIVELLIEKGADVNMVNNFNEISLHLACEYGSKELIEFLIANGADVKAEDKNHLTPAHRAYNSGHKDFIVLFLDRYPGLLPTLNEDTLPKGLERNTSLWKLFTEGSIPSYDIAGKKVWISYDIEKYFLNNFSTTFKSVIDAEGNPLDLFLLPISQEKIGKEIQASYPKRQIRIWCDQWVKDHFEAPITPVLSLYTPVGTYFKNQATDLLPPEPIDVEIKDYITTIGNYQSTNPNQPFYVDPQSPYLVLNGQQKTFDELKIAVTSFCDRVINQTPFQGTPPEKTEALKEFYKTITLYLKNVFHVIQQKKGEEKEKCLLKVFKQLAFSSGYCGPQYVACAKSLYYEFCLQKKLDFTENVSSILEELREIALESMQNEEDINENQSVHAVSYYRSVLSKNFGWDDAVSRIAQKDPFHSAGFKNWAYPHEAKVKEAFFKFYNQELVMNTLRERLSNEDMKDQWIEWMHKNLQEECPSHDHVDKLRQEMKKREQELTTFVIESRILPQKIELLKQEIKALQSKEAKSVVQKKLMEQQLTGKEKALAEYEERFEHLQKTNLSALTDSLLNAAESNNLVYNFNNNGTFLPAVETQMNETMNEWALDSTTGKIKERIILLIAEKLGIIEIS